MSCVRIDGFVGGSSCGEARSWWRKGSMIVAIVGYGMSRLVTIVELTIFLSVNIC
jgi:hypothetical protein